VPNQRRYSINPTNHAIYFEAFRAHSRTNITHTAFLLRHKIMWSNALVSNTNGISINKMSAGQADFDPTWKK